MMNVSLIFVPFSSELQFAVDLVSSRAAEVMVSVCTNLGI